MPAGHERRRGVLRAVVLAATLATAAVAAPAALSGARASTADTAAPRGLVTVRLATPDYGRLGRPEAVVAAAGPQLFTFTPGRQGATTGPNTFDVGPDGSVWVLGKTFVEWPAGSPSQPLTVPLPAPVVTDFGIAADGTIYVTSGYGGPQLVYALSPGGRLRWKAPYDGAAAIAPLRIGADQVAYVATSSGQQKWTPLTTTTGDPLSTLQQRSGTALGLPVDAGRRLADLDAAARERRLVLLDRHGTTVSGWRLTSGSDDLATVGTPAVVGDDLVVTIGFSRNENGQFRYEFETLRLAPSGRVVAAVTTSARSVWGDPLTSVRIGPDGALYQLETSPVTGVRVVRYRLDGLDGAVTASGSPSPSSSSSSSSSPPPSQSQSQSQSQSSSGLTPPAVAGTASGTDDGTNDGTSLEIAAVVAAVGSITIAGALWWRSRRRAAR
jgi:hypothetical protein